MIKVGNIITLNLDSVLLNFLHMSTTHIFSGGGEVLETKYGVITATF